MMASMNSKQFEGNPTNPTSVAEVLGTQIDAEKDEIQKDGPIETVDDTDGYISDAVEPKITGEAQPKKKNGVSVCRASPKSICVTFDSLSAIENVKVNTNTKETKNSGLHTFVRPDGGFSYILSFNL